MTDQTAHRLATELESFDIASHRILNAVCMMAEIEAMKAENAEREAQGKTPAHGYKQFMNAIERWHYDG